MEAEQVTASTVEAVTPVVSEAVVAEKPVEEKPVETPVVDDEKKVEEVSEPSVETTSEPAASVAEEAQPAPQVDEVEMADETDVKNEQLSVEEPKVEEAAAEEAKPIEETVKAQVEEQAKEAEEEKASADESVPMDASSVEPESEKSTEASIVPPVLEVESNEKTENKTEGTEDKATEEKSGAQPVKKQKIDFASMAVRQYLDHTVVPILLAGLAAVAKSRPEDPIEYLSKYLIDNRSKYDNNQENSSLNGNQ